MGLKHLFFLLFYLGMTLFFASCGNEVAQESQKAVYRAYEKEKIAVNQEIVRREHADIALIAKRYNWNLVQTSSGLFYEILNKKEGNYPQTKDRVQLKGKIYLQDGTEVYNDKMDGIKELIINRSDDPIGLHELIKLMREGEKSHAIIPSYLAYGISGDGEQIPALSFLLCEIELIKIN
jgi:FKBP-type peptidyl-prolyl cis-trans isomerase